MHYTQVYEPALRIGFFLGLFAAMAALEALIPWRRSVLGRAVRWPHNLALLAVDIAVLRVLAPGAAIAVAVLGEARGWGLLNTVAPPAWLGIALAVAFLDLVIYFQHVAFHATPGLWRLHRVHHTDTEVDVTTGTRFHPAEILLSTAIKCAAVAAIGAPAVAVLAFEILLNATSMFNHANVRLPDALERVLRRVIVTPGMHRVHHSADFNDTSSNFGFSLPWWDRILGTYREAPARGCDAMVIGVDAFRSRQDARIDRLLVQPALDTAGHYPINRREEAGT